MNNDIKNGIKKGRIFVVSAPSGAGKTTLCRELLNKVPEISYSISHTTRQPRKNEIEGKDYYFITTKDFEEKIDQGFFVEWAKVHTNYYGTSRKHLEKQTHQGSNILLEIDIKGAKQIKKLFPDAVTIFIMAPSIDVLEQRLRQRATDTDEVINMRLENAKAEIDQKDFNDFIIVNDGLEKACKRICEVVKGNL
ncbi:MAG: guanylate kinase [Desulfobacteraceae bacterium]|nr:guanylate kinase [Desulfobacteraceae bacterium]